MRLVTTFLALLMSTAALAVVPQETAQLLKSDPSKGRVHFEAVGKPSFIKIKGEGDGPTGQVRIHSGGKDNIEGEFQFKVASLVTGISLRDKHMKEKYLHAEKYPTAELKIESVKTFKPGATEATNLPFTGKLTVHGVTQPVAGTVNINKHGAGYAVKAQFEAKITAHAIDVPSYAGITVADAVKVSVETQLQ